jgi:hypothetical protein
VERRLTVGLKKRLKRFWHDWLKSLLIVVLAVGRSGRRSQTERRRRDR